MDTYITRATLVRFNHWMVSLQERRVPQMFVALSGATGILTGVLFLAVPWRLEQSPAVDYMTNAIPVPVWIVAFFAFGFILITCAIVKYSAATLPCFAFALVMFVFTILSAVDVAEGPATGIITVLAFAFGCVNTLTAILAVAPITEQLIEEDQ